MIKGVIYLLLSKPVKNIFIQSKDQKSSLLKLGAGLSAIYVREGVKSDHVSTLVITEEEIKRFTCLPLRIEFPLTNRGLARQEILSW